MSTNRTLRAVPTPATDPTKPRTETEEKLWQALRDNPGSTATALSTAAGIGKSTAPKILSRWEKDGLITRTAGIADGGSRPADRWSITTDDQPTDHEPSDNQQTDNQPTDHQSWKQSEKSQRLAPGALRGLVEDYLRDNPGEFSPNAIGKALDRSPGAVHNALESWSIAATPCEPVTSRRSTPSPLQLPRQRGSRFPVAGRSCRHLPPTSHRWRHDDVEGSMFLRKGFRGCMLPQSVETPAGCDPGPGSVPTAVVMQFVGLPDKVDDDEVADALSRGAIVRPLPREQVAPPYFPRRELRAGSCCKRVRSPCGGTTRMSNPSMRYP